MLSFIFVIVCGPFVHVFYIIILYQYRRWRSNSRGGRIGILLIVLFDLNLPHFLACPKTEPGLPWAYVLGFCCCCFVFYGFRYNVVVNFVDIGEIVDKWLVCFTQGLLIYLLPKPFKLFCFPTFRLWASPDDGYSINASCALNLISMFLFKLF